MDEGPRGNRRDAVATGEHNVRDLIQQSDDAFEGNGANGRDGRRDGQRGRNDADEGDGPRDGGAAGRQIGARVLPALQGGRLQPDGAKKAAEEACCSVSRPSNQH